MPVTIKARRTRNNTIPNAPTYADLEALIDNVTKRSSQRLLKNALSTLYKARSRRPSDPADDLADASIELTIKVCRKWLTARKRSIGHCGNVERGIRRLSSMLRMLVRIPPKKSKLIIPKMFDLQNPHSSWGTHNRQNRVAKSYFLKHIPQHVEKQLSIYLNWRDGKNSRFLEVADLAGKVRRLFARSSWSRPSKADDTKRTASERYTREYIQGFFGFLSLPKNPSDPRFSGLEIPKEKVKFGHLLCGKLVAQFLEFLAVRADGELTTHAGNFVRIWRQLVAGSESYGRWAQRECCSDLIAILGRNAPRTPLAWHNWISEQSDIVEEAVARLSHGRTGRMRFRTTRDPSIQLAMLLEYRNPLKDVVWPTIRKMISLRQSVSPLKKYDQSDVKRSDDIQLESLIFTLTAFTVAPFRLRNWTEMQWGVNLFRCPRGRWRFSIPVGNFKNRKSARRGYEAEVQEVAQGIFTAFYEAWKNYHKIDPLGWLANKKPYFVMSLQKGKASDPPHRDTVRHRLLFLKEAWNLTVGPNAFRHIVATDWLKSHPNDWDTVAGMLNDSVDTVAKNYAHLTAQDHIRRINEYNENLLGVDYVPKTEAASRKKPDRMERRLSKAIKVSNRRHGGAPTKQPQAYRQPHNSRKKSVRTRKSVVVENRKVSVKSSRHKRLPDRKQVSQENDMSPLMRRIMASLSSHKRR